jgi:hypothetical protein
MRYPDGGGLDAADCPPALGRAQAQQLGRRRGGDGITAVFSSDLTRATQTATIAFGQSAIPVLYDWRLRECDYGQRNGMPAAELRAGRREHLDRPYPGGESWRQAVAASGGSSPTCHCAGTGSESCSSVIPPPDGAWTTSSAACRWKT